MNIEEIRRLAVISDIHGNLHALKAVMSEIDQMQIRTVICCGDVVGYGAFPNECVEMLRFRRIPTLAGNHDHAAIGKTDVRYFNEIAKRAVAWTEQRLSQENMDWLASRPFTYEVDENFYCAHASPHNPDLWGYVLTFGDARNCFREFTHPFCFIGHSHQPAIVRLNGEQLDCPEGAVTQIDPAHRYLINVGSVGQPRDHNPDSCWVSVDLDEGQIEFHRTTYDVAAAQQAILHAGLPEELAERLGFGW